MSERHRAGDRQNEEWGRKSRGHLRVFAGDTRGVFTVWVAVMMPVFLVLVGLLFDTGMLFAQVHSAYRVAATACERAVKPTRTMTPLDATRQASIERTYDILAAQAKLTVTSRSVTINWLDVNIGATLSYKTMFATLLKVNQVSWPVSVHCVGIPPYPHDGEVILSSNFTKPDGSTLAMSCWDVFKYNQFGWDEGTGPGVEIQDWGGGCYGSLPTTDFPSKYVVELDSDYAVDTNSSITKVIELHPGTYQFSVWYNGRIQDTASNIIAVYLQQTRPTTGSKVLLYRMAEKGSKGWIRYVTTVTVSAYSIYKLTIAAEGTDDTYGGLINSFTVKYIDR